MDVKRRGAERCGLESWGRNDNLDELHTSQFPIKMDKIFANELIADAESKNKHSDR